MDFIHLCIGQMNMGTSIAHSLLYYVAGSAGFVMSMAKILIHLLFLHPKSWEGTVEGSGVVFRGPSDAAGNYIVVCCLNLRILIPNAGSVYRIERSIRAPFNC